MQSFKVANLALRGLAAVSALLTVYILANYEYYFVGEPLSSWVMYSLPAAAFLALIGAERLRPELRLNIALAVVSLGFTAYAAEALVSFLAAARELPEGFDRRAKVEVIRDLRKQGIDAVPVQSPGGFLVAGEDGARSRFETDGVELMPLGGIAGKTIVDCNENGEWMIYESDERGFRNPKGLWSASRMAIATVGDSFTHGNCVGDGMSYVGRIRKRYAHTLNLGKTGNGPLIELASLKEYLPLVRPRVVIWFFFENNDLSDLQRERESDLLRKYLRTGFSQGLAGRQEEIDLAVTQWIEETERDLDRASVKRPSFAERAARFLIVTKLRGLLVQSIPSIVHIPKEKGSGDESIYALFSEILTEADKVVSSWGGTLYFVYLPAQQRYRAALFQDLRHIDGMRKRIVETAEALELPVTDVTESFDRQDDKRALFSTLGPHYSEEGNRVAAEPVLARLPELLRDLSTGAVR